MKPLYIFDLDGTLALIKHRRHFVEREPHHQDWERFYAACVDDGPNGWFDSWKSTYAEAKQREAEIKAMPTRADAVVFIREHTVPTEPKALAKWLAINAR